MTTLHGRMSRMVRFVACCVLLVMTLVLVGCSSLDERAVRTGITEALDCYQSPTAEEAQACLVEVGLDASDLAEVGIDVPTFISQVFAHFAYEIQEVSVEDGRATARVSLTGTDCRPLMRQLEDEMAADADAYDAEILADDGARQLSERYFELLAERLAEAEPQKRSVTLQLTKTEGAWVLDEESADVLVDAVFGE